MSLSRRRYDTIRYDIAATELTQTVRSNVYIFLVFQYYAYIPSFIQSDADVVAVVAVVGAASVDGDDEVL